MLRGTFRCTVGVGFSDCNNRDIPFACLLGVGAALFVCLFFFDGWLGRLRNRSYVDARQLQQFFERLYLYGSRLLTSSSLTHALPWLTYPPDWLSAFIS